MLRQGFELPELKYEIIKKQGNFLPIASFDMDTNTLVVNSSQEVKKRGGMKKIGERWVSENWNTQRNPILHEMGHLVHDIIDKDAYANKDQVFNFGKERITSQVSRYAATKRGEFEAELIAGILSGKQYSEEILTITALRFSEDERAQRIYRLGTGEIPNDSGLPRKFDNMMEALHQDKPETLAPDFLKEEAVQEYIKQHARVLDNAVDYTIRQRPLDDISVQRLKESNYVFSGFKTFHELNEAFPSLLDADGSRKPFERFLNDVQMVNETYNRHYLNAEYNFAMASADMAAKWQGWWTDEDRDRYLLQYRTVGDERVRRSHRLMHNITLPITSRFWNSYFPPNGWNCRCTVERVRRGKYPESNEHEALLAGSQATTGKHQEMMRFNPGKQMACFPAYNPYSIGKCRECPDRPGQLKLAKVPDNELCAACKVIRGMTKERDKIKKLYEAYDEKRWEKHLYDNDTGGYLVTERSRIEAGRRNKQEQAKYDKEHEMCRMFARAGYRIEHLGETPGISSPDVTINGMPADLKRTKGSGNIVKYARKAVRQQGAEMVLFQFDEFNDAVRKELIALKREGIKAKYFITGENEVHTL